MKGLLLACTLITTLTVPVDDRFAPQGPLEQVIELAVCDGWLGPSLRVLRYLRVAEAEPERRLGSPEITTHPIPTRPPPPREGTLP